MRSSIFFSSVLLAGFSAANPHLSIRQPLPIANSSSFVSTSSTSASSHYSSSSTLKSSSQLSSSSSSQLSSSSSSQLSSSSSSQLSSSSSSQLSSSSSSQLSSSSSSSSTSSTSTVSPTSSRSSLSSSSKSSSGSISSTSSNTISLSSSSSLTTSNSTPRTASNTSTPAPTECTGCVLEALSPYTITFPKSQSTLWTSTVVPVGTIITQIITYEGDGGVTTEFVTVNETKTISVIADQTNLFSSQFFTWVPTPSVTLTFEPGSTYVAYTRLYGGLDFQPTPTDSEAPVMTGTLDISDPEPTCEADVSFLYVWPGAAEEYSLFIQTYTNAPGNSGDSPVSLPPAAIQYLSKHPEIQSVFNGSDIATCTQRPTLTTSISTELTSVFQTIGTKPPPRPSQPASIQFPPESSAPDRSAPFDTPKPTSTYVSSSYASSSMHITRPGYLRTPKPNPEPSPGPGPNSPPNPPNPPQSPDIPAVIASILNDPKFTPAPQPPPNNPEQSIAIGNTVVPVHPVIQNPQNPQNPQNQQNPQNPGIVIGSQTLAPGQATTINGVVVSVPNGGGPSVVVGGTTIGVNPAAPTGPAVLTVGGNTITANPQGQFVVGSQTLTPGGPAIIVDGSTLSLGPSGTIAVVNGVTQTLANAPFITGPPALTINGQIIPATVRNGVTQFVVGPGQTLTPGGVIVVGGTTYSMPDDGSGSTIVVNGVTQTLNNAFGLPVLTLNGQSLIPATVVGGTTMWVVGPGQTLTPGGVIVVSGTTFSMPATASGSVVVINGVTSTLGQGPITAAPALTINGKTYSATVVDGTTQYILGPGTTLKPGEAITIDGTTYSLDPKGTALIINGKTSSIPKTPASNSATTTGSGSMSESTSRSSSRSSSRSTTSARDAGNFIASGIGITSKKGDAIRVGGLDKWAEGVVIGIAGWLLMLL